MRFEERHTFEQPAATVMKMYSDRAFFDRKYKDVGAIEFELLDQQKEDYDELVDDDGVPLPKDCDGSAKIAIIVSTR